MANLNRYSLADYTVAIAFDGHPELSINIGGPGENQAGSFMGQVTVSRNADTWSTEGDVTGSWVHNKSLNRTGTISVQIRQVSDDVLKLFNIMRTYDSEDLAASIAITRGDTTVITGSSCYLTKMADQVFGDTAEMQTWVWTCGQIIMNEQSSNS